MLHKFVQSLTLKSLSNITIQAAISTMNSNQKFKKIDHFPENKIWKNAQTFYFLNEPEFDWCFIQLNL